MLDLDNPISFTDKMQWLKLYDRKPIYTIMVDKFAVREYISQTIGEEYLIPLIAVWNSVDEIDINLLPEKFVLKCTHDSGGVLLCKNKQQYNKESIKRFFEPRMKYNYYMHSREYAYKGVKPRIICEEYMTDESGIELKDYKVWCFNGKAEYVFLDYDRTTTHHRNIYDTNWNQVPLTINDFYSDEQREFKKPEVLEQMIVVAERLSKDIPFIRVDFYVVNDRLYFGELTFFPGAGFQKFDPPEFANIFGDKLVLPINSMQSD